MRNTFVLDRPPQCSVKSRNTRVPGRKREKYATLRCERECCPRDTVIGARSVQFRSSVRTAPAGSD